MSDDPTRDALAVLDRRGHAAAAGLRSAAADRPAPVFEPDLVRIDVDARPSRAPRQRRSLTLLVVAAAVLVVVAAVVALVGASPDPDDAPADRITPEGLRRYVLGDVPRGFELNYVRDIDAPTFPPAAEIERPGPMTVYGPDRQRPMAGVFVIPDGGSSTDLPMEVQGVPRIDGSVGPRMWDLTDTAGEDSVAVEVDQQYVGVLGTDARTRDLAAAVEIRDGRAVIPAAALPDGWSDLGQAMAYDGYPGTYGLEAEEDGRVWIAQYGRRFGTDRAELVRVTAASGDPVRAWVAALGADDVETVEVRGHDALLAHFDGSGGLGGYSLTWEERPGEIVQIVALDTFGRAGMIGLAGGVEVVGAEEVPDLVDQTLVAGTTDPGVTIVGRGTFTTGDRWLLAHGPAAGEVVLRTTADQLSNHGFEAADAADAVEPTLFGAMITYGVATDVAWADGIIDEGVAEVEVHGPDGTVHQATIVEADGIRGWVAELPPAGDPERVPGYEIRALDADGRLVDTFTISA